jgi:hypothetical protein
VATNVRVIADPALPRIEQLSERVGTAESKHSRPGGHVDAHCGWWGCADVAAVSGVMRVRGSLVSRDFL